MTSSDIVGRGRGPGGGSGSPGGLTFGLPGPLEIRWDGERMPAAAPAATAGRSVPHQLPDPASAGLAAGEHPGPRGVVARRMLDFYLHSADRCATALREHRQPLRLDPPAAGVRPVDVTGAEAAARAAWHAALDLLAEPRHPYAEVVRDKLVGR